MTVKGLFSQHFDCNSPRSVIMKIFDSWCTYSGRYFSLAVQILATRTDVRDNNICAWRLDISGVPDLAKLWPVSGESELVPNYIVQIIRMCSFLDF